MNYVLLFSTSSLSVSKYRDYSVKDDVIVPYRGMMIRTQFYSSDYLLSRDLVNSVVVQWNCTVACGCGGLRSTLPKGRMSLLTLKEHQLVLTIAIYQRFLIPIVNNGELF